MEKFEITNPQKSIWVTEEFYKGTSIEIIAGTTTIEGTVNFDKLKQAINLFVKNTASFRLKFVNENNKILQYISDYEELNFELVDVESEKDVKRLEKEFSSTPFKIFDSLMFKFKLFKFKDGHGGFIVAGHHMLVDAWACGLVISNVLKIYDSLVHGIEFNEELYSYIDYIKSEQEYLSSNKYLKDKEFWDEQFKFIPESATIPGTLQSNEISSSAKRKLFKIPAETMELINAYCKDNKISPFNFFMGVYSLYISRATSLDEFVIGTPVLNRSNVKEKHTMGMFISVVPFKVNVNEEKSFADFTKQISSNFFSIFKHQKYPYQTLLEDVRKQNPSVPNLFNIMLSYQNMRTETKNTGTKYETEWLFNGHISDDIDIHFFDINDSGIINVAYDYKTSKYTAEDIYALHSRMLNIINQILENNNISLKDIEIVTPDERDEILYKFNDTKMDYPKDKTIIQLFEEQVEKTPDNIAVVFEDQKLTYKELNEKANSLAYYLKKNGLKKHNIVSLFLDKSLESMIAILATLKCDSIYMPIDINYPNTRIAFMISNSNSSMILTSNNLKKKVLNYSNVYCIDLSTSEIYNNTYKNISKSSTSEDVAYIMYTSGSTGEPKGVMVSNKNVVRLIKNTNFIHFKNQEHILQTGSIVFDACTFEIWGALLNGFELYIIKKQDLLDPTSLEKYLIKNKITILWLTAPLFNQLSENNPKMFSTVRVLLTGGDVLSPKHINAVRDACPKLTIINGYGPTENTTFSTCFTIDNNYETSIPIGYPIANSTCYIVSKSNKLMPVGVSGELLVGGDGVSKGYLNNLDYTKTKYITNQFGNGLLYKTGDLVKWRKDGSIEFIGRVDNQVKIRGFRVELNEINLKIQEFKNIKECYTIVKSINNEKTLCSYFSAEREIDTWLLREFLKGSLPPYSIPTYFIEMESLPINTNGKVDIKKLPEPKNINTKSEIVLPRNETDKKIINILMRLLNINSISMDDNFFELGGDSLSAINLCAKIKKEFNADILVKDILEYPKIQAISDIIIKQKSILNNETILPVDKSDSYCVSSAQQRIYFASTIAGNYNVLYNIPGGIILDKKIDSNKLEKCIKILIDRHESLRTFFEVIDGQVVQKILDTIDFKLNIIDNVHFENLDKTFHEFLKPFDLSKAPLFRVSLIYFTNGKCAIFLDMHHIISDGTSMSIIIDELCKLYNNELLPELKITYKDYACFEHNKLTSGALKEAENYWLSQFEDEIPQLNLPTKNSRPAIQSFEGKKIYSSINMYITTQIKNISKSLGVTPYMLMLSAYYVLLSKYTSQDDLVVGTPVVGRDNAETYNLIGMFVNTLALRQKIDDSLTFKEFLNKVKSSLLSSYEYQTYPFDELVNKLQIKRDPSRNPLFDTMFAYQNNGFKQIHFNDIQTDYYIPDTGISKFDLSVEAIPNDNGLTISFEYNTKLFDESFINDMSNHYLNIINTILENTDITISSIDMLSKEEKNKILYEFNNTKMVYPKDNNIVQLFEEQAEKNPDNIAVVFEDQKLTYKELNEKANSLANHLIELGALKNSVIPVIINRSPELIISLFAIIKAGCAYLPISPDMPSERISYILQNSGSKIVITAPTQKVVFDDTIKVINIQDFDFTKHSTKNLSLDIKPQDLLYIIYTSGSTGNPKGVKVCHKNLVNFIYSFNSLFENITPKDKLLASTNISFDVSIFEIFMPLLNGASLYLYDEPNINDIFRYCKALVKNKITFAYIPPNILEDVYNVLSSYSNIPLNKILLGVEPIKTSTIKKYYMLNPDLKIINAYGPTEATICATAVLLDKNILKDYKILPIGRPLSNLNIFILDKNLQPVPIGVLGQIFISGDNVSKGYLNNAELTEKSFVPLPHLDCKLAYATGDLAKWDENGIINFIGRNDSQIKINGHRIELGEIESCIYLYPNIDKVVVLLDKNNKLNCYFSSDQQININDLKAFMQRKLPSYFIPNYFVQVEKFKLTQNGKIDKKALQKIKIDTSNTFEPPETEYQSKLVGVFETVLGINHIGITDNFFELGGDSLLAIKLQIEAFNNGLDISYKDIFNYPTVKQLSENISSTKVHKFNDEYDYTQINDLLKKNTYSIGNIISKNKFKNILLTGATGFMGSHILDSLLRKTKCNIYCLVRVKDNNDPQVRLLNTLRFYFGNKYDKEIFKRIVVIEGDISKDNLGIDEIYHQELGFNIDCVINSAAIVKHYGNLDTFTSTNIQGVKNIIEFCSKYGCKLFHLSTLSVSGNIFETDSYQVADLSKDIIFNEQKLFIGQDLSNVYIYTKFIAERLILESIINGKLDAKIIRLGNITNRYSDGIFQINVSENAFLNRINSILHIGCIPDYLLDKYIEFSPVDLCAEAIIKLVFEKSNMSIYHVYNNNHITFRELVKSLNNLKVPVEIVDKETFNKKIKKISSNIETKNMISGIINDFDKNKELSYNTNIRLQNVITNKYLRLLSFKWPKINEKYLRKYIIYLKSIGYIK